VSTKGQLGLGLGVDDYEERTEAKMKPIVEMALNTAGVERRAAMEMVDAHGLVPVRNSLWGFRFTDAYR